MTFQFIVEYIDPKEAGLPFDFNRLIHSKRVRAKNGEQAIKIFKKKYPGYEAIGWR